MKRAGVERKGSAWYVRSPEVITVVSLQKSNFGPSFYCNVGFWLTAVDGGTEKHPKPVAAHVRARAQSLFNAEEDHITALLDAEAAMGPGERLHGIRRLVDDQLLPFCARVTTPGALRALVSTGPLRHLPVFSQAARDVLERG